MPAEVVVRAVAEELQQRVAAEVQPEQHRLSLVDVAPEQPQLQQQVVRVVAVEAAGITIPSKTSASDHVASGPTLPAPS
jgi:hypothetical protein